MTGDHLADRRSVVRAMPPRTLTADPRVAHATDDPKRMSCRSRLCAGRILHRVRRVRLPPMPGGTQLRASRGTHLGLLVTSGCSILLALWGPGAALAAPDRSLITYTACIEMTGNAQTF